MITYRYFEVWQFQLRVSGALLVLDVKTGRACYVASLDPRLSCHMLESSETIKILSDRSPEHLGVGLYHFGFSSI